MFWKVFEGSFSHISKGFGVFNHKAFGIGVEIGLNAIECNRIDSDTGSMKEESVEVRLKHFEGMGHITYYFVLLGYKWHFHAHVGYVDIAISFACSWVIVVAMGMGKLWK